MKVSGKGRKDIKIKEEYEYLRWLIVHIKHKNTTTNYVRRHLLTERLSDPEDDDDDDCVMPMTKLPMIKLMVNMIVLIMKAIQYNK